MMARSHNRPSLSERSRGTSSGYGFDDGARDGVRKVGEAHAGRPFSRQSAKHQTFAYTR